MQIDFQLEFLAVCIIYSMFLFVCNVSDNNNAKRIKALVFLFDCFFKC